MDILLCLVLPFSCLFPGLLCGERARLVVFGAFRLEKENGGRWYARYIHAEAICYSICMSSLAFSNHSIEILILPLVGGLWWP